MARRARRLLTVLSYVFIIVIAVYLRTSGLFRGLNEGYTYHPDEPKQVAALGQFLAHRYVWYTDSWYYDGYPLGLNHVDEWLLRPLLSVMAASGKHVMGNQAMSHGPGFTLYYAARSLRVLYGVLCLWMTVMIARRLFGERRAVRWAALLFAVAPLSVAVSHYATGDIGTDLFGALGFLFLCLYARRQKRCWLFGSGLAVGAAFACKYNGALVGLSVAAYVLLEAVRHKRIGLFVRNAMVSLAGFVSGAILLTPACFINWEQTWQDVFINFRMIQQFGVPADYASKSLASRVTGSLVSNLPGVGGGLGWTVLLLAAVGLVVSLREARQKGERAKAERSTAFLRIAVFSMPFIALLISMVGKPELQPFHFSYLQIPLILAAVYAFSRGRQSARPVLRFGALALLTMALAEFAVKAERENFFWERDDTRLLSNRFAGLVLNGGEMQGEKTGEIKNLYLEPPNCSVFRNLRKTVTCKGGWLWNQVQVAPAPCVPVPLNGDWIFLNGPVFPRSDRLFKVEANRFLQKMVVMSGEPEEIRIGLRSGMWPVEVSVDVGGKVRAFQLDPHAQTVARFQPRRWRRSAGKGLQDVDQALVPVIVAATGGSAWIVVMEGDREEQHFRLFGGEAKADLSFLNKDVSWGRMAKALEACKYIEGGEVIVDASDPIDARCLLPEKRMALACGRYRLECETTVLSGRADIVVVMEDLLKGVAALDGGKHYALDRETRSVSYPFSKSFAPLECRLAIQCDSGRVRIDSWRIVPDVEAMFRDLQSWEEGSVRPDWLRRAPSGVALEKLGEEDAMSFSDSITVEHFSFPPVVTNGAPLKLTCGMRVDRFPFPHIEDHHVFLHIRDPQGERVHMDGFPLWQALANRELNLPVVLGAMTNAAAGEYSVELGVWNARTRKRLSLSGPGLSKKEIRKRKIRIAEMRVVE